MNIIEIKSDQINKNIQLKSMRDPIIVVGDNGIGKTIVLESIYSIYESMFMYSSNITIRRGEIIPDHNRIKELMVSQLNKVRKDINSILPPDISVTKIHEAWLKEIDIHPHIDHRGQSFRKRFEVYFQGQKENITFYDIHSFTAGVLFFIIFGQKQRGLRRNINPLIPADRTNVIEYEKARMFTRMSRLSRGKLQGKNSMVSWMSNAKDYKFNIKDREYYFYELSAGYKSLAILSLYHSLDNGLLFIDEPEAHLSVKSQMEWVREFYSNQSFRTIIATHSDVLCRMLFKNNNNVNFLLVSNEDIVKKTSIEEIDQYFMGQFHEQI